MSDHELRVRLFVIVQLVQVKQHITHSSLSAGKFQVDSYAFIDYSNTDAVRQHHRIRCIPEGDSLADRIIPNVNFGSLTWKNVLLRHHTNLQTTSHRLVIN